jgi:hypothetical protein
VAAVTKVAADSVAIISSLPKAEKRNRALRRLCPQTGAVTSLLGMQSLNLYGVEEISSNTIRLGSPKSRSVN